MLKELFDYIRNTNQPIFDGFADKADVLAQYAEPAENCEDIDIVYGLYEVDGYDGSSMVIYFDRKDNNYYEVHGSHCSCYGLEEQWRPSAILFKEFENRYKFDFFGNQISLAQFPKIGPGTC